MAVLQMPKNEALFCVLSDFLMISGSQYLTALDLSILFALFLNISDRQRISS